MTSESIGDSIEDRILMQQHRPGPSRHTILRTTLIILAASAVLGVAAIAPNAALAFGPPPPPPALAGPPPGLAGPPPGSLVLPPGVGGLPRPGLAGPPPRPGVGSPAGVPRLGNPPGLRGGRHGVQRNLHGRSAAKSYGRSARYSYGRNGGRSRYYGVYINGNYGSSSNYADDGCYYTYSYRRHRRVIVCSGD